MSKRLNERPCLYIPKRESERESEREGVGEEGRERKGEREKGRERKVGYILT